MICRVIISHNQTEHLKRFPVGPPTVVVLDAPTEADLIACRRLCYTAAFPTQTGHRGLNRNTGLVRLQGDALLCQDDIVEFFDGDRYPVQYDGRVVSSLMEAHNLDVLLYACAQDSRLERISVPSKGAALVDTGTVCNPFYSCGFAIRVPAIEKIREFNGGPLFEPSFTRWGCEDQYLGLVCARLGLRVALTAEVLLAGAVGGDCDLHEDYRESLQQYVDLIVRRGFEVHTEPRACEALL